MRKLVLCMGNDLLGDDAVGPRVAELLMGRVGEGVDVECTSAPGLYLLDYLAGYDFAVIVDAFVPPDPVPGRITVYDIEASDKPPKGPSPHYTSLADALNVGKRMGLSLPGRITVVGIEVKDPWTLGADMTPGVAEAVAKAAERVMEIVECTR